MKRIGKRKGESVTISTLRTVHRLPGIASQVAQPLGPAIEKGTTDFGI